MPTKGPWRVGKVQSVVGIVVRRGDLPANTNHVRICRNVSNEEDARLISAAPDLLLALKWVAAHAYGETTPFGEVPLVRDAIAKAEGREPDLEPTRK